MTEFLINAAQALLLLCGLLFIACLAAVARGLYSSRRETFLDDRISGLDFEALYARTQADDR